MIDTKLSNDYIHVYNLSERSGRKFVVADIHGCYDEFMLCLEKLNFNFYTDTIFSLGDIVDRGSDNIKSMSLIKEPWFKMIMGNHEAMIAEDFYDNAFGNGNAWAAAIHYTENHEHKVEFNQFKSSIHNLPYVFDLRWNTGKRYVCAHAELPRICLKEADCSYELLNADSDLKYFTEIWPRECNVLWGRYQFIRNEFFPQAEWIFHGHTIFKEPLIKQNVVYMDQGFFHGYMDYKEFDPSFGTLNFVELNEVGLDVLHSITVGFGEDPYVISHNVLNLELGHTKCQPTQSLDS